MGAIRIADFDTWRPGYGGAVVTVKQANSDTNATIYSDEALTTAISNPVTLQSKEVNGVYYGKFAAPIYVGVPFELDIDSTDETGIIRIPLTTLSAEDASDAVVTRTSGSVAHPIDDIVARTAYVKDFGVFLPTSDASASANTNTTTLNAAIGAVSSGGFVIIPAGTFEFVQVSLPANVILQGQGKGVTILLSETADDVMTMAGDAAGMIDLTLDGNTLQAGSNGIRAKNKDRLRLDRVNVKRFATGLYIQGSSGNEWKDLDVQGNTIGAKLHGDLDSGNGDEFEDNSWHGRCYENVTYGVDLSYVDTAVRNTHLRLAFVDNAGIAFRTRGAQRTDLRGSSWVGNTTNIDVDDFDDDNPIVGLHIGDFRIQGGEIDFAGWCEDVLFDRGKIDGTVAITLTLPEHNILVRDVTEGTSVSLAGDGEKWTRWTTADHGASSGQTTDAVATKAWGMYLEPGQRAYLEGKVIGNARTSDESAEYHIAVSARRPPSTLDYENQSANFTPGVTLTGGTSGATALIVSDTDAGTTGTLELRNIVGAFVDGEAITDSSAGAAEANGTLVAVNVELLGSVTSLRTAREDDAGWDAAFVANNPEIELRVTGATSKTVDWHVHVDVIKT